MIIKSLLFIILLIFIYETIQKTYKIYEEYFSSPFVSLSTNDNNKNDIAKTIAINCKLYPQEKNKIMTAKPTPIDTLNTPYYSLYKPLEYNPNRKYYWRRDILIPEGIRRSQDDDEEIKHVQDLNDAETDLTKKEILQDELDLFKWRNYILQTTNPNNNEPRTMRDIITDYYPTEINMVRPWLEPHSHIPDYSNSLNKGYKTYNKPDEYYN